MSCLDGRWHAQAEAIKNHMLLEMKCVIVDYC
jgi:hypothetical protein